jgi:hypothetical protein
MLSSRIHFSEYGFSSFGKLKHELTTRFEIVNVAILIRSGVITFSGVASSVGVVRFGMDTLLSHSQMTIPTDMSFMEIIGKGNLIQRHPFIVETDTHKASDF